MLYLIIFTLKIISVDFFTLWGLLMPVVNYFIISQLRAHSHYNKENILQASAQDNRLDALNNIEQAGRLQIFNLPENIEDDYDFRCERDRLSSLTYNFGLEAVNRKQSDDAIRWLGLSFDSEKSRKPIRPKLLVDI